MIKRISNSSHLMVSAFKDHRRAGVIRVISIVKRDELQKLYCLLCHTKTNTSATSPGPGHGAAPQCELSEAKVEIHTDHYHFPYGTSDIFCNSTPSSMEATHVAITADPNTVQSSEYLLIKNKKIAEPFQYDFTVCISNLFGDYNNALQFLQTMEVYKLMGIQRVVIYNTSSGPDVEKVLKYYKKEGMLEVVPWPIDKFLNPSRGWQPDKDPGDLHYYGQTTTLNECIYRYMYQSRYLLLNDIDEIIMPYNTRKIPNLVDFVDDLQKKYPKAGVFRFENRVYPRTVCQCDDGGRFRLLEWESVPGANILQHIYNQPYNGKEYKEYKMIIDPRRVEQTSVHQALETFGAQILVPFDICHVIHITFRKKHVRYQKELYEDRKLWEFETNLIPIFNHALHKSGLLK
ncbi:uncharacterized protein LOC134441192 [Engraulis encrasicolus]|uniref:uncharacterized protein LOC134441192 n=1 Tax=Engraulis encrasicolus TaxID=184585 RepID=UPI002FD78D4B